MAAVVQVRLAEDRLRVDFGSRPELGEGQARLLFVNILGFAYDETGQAYVSQGLPTPSLVREVLGHLKEAGVDFELDSGVRDAIRSQQADAAALEEARTVGRKLRDEPATRFECPALVRALKPYQVPAADHMVRVQHAANFSVPGAGKTTIVLAAFENLRAAGVVELLVVVGPHSSFMSWEDEWRASFGQAAKVTRIAGSRVIRRLLYESARASELVLVGYHTMAVDVEELGSLIKARKSMMVLDESHHVKRLVGGIWAPAALALGELAAKRVILSGTPVPNGMEDLWSQMTFLWPRPPVLGSVDEYKERLRGGKREDANEIRKSVEPLFWRIRKSELKLPAPKFHRLDVDMKQYQAAIYRVLAAKVLSEVVSQPKERAKLRIWRRARVTRLLQVATNPSLVSEYSPEFRVPPMDASGLPVEEIVNRYSHFETPSKLAATVELARRLMGKGEKVIIWTSFVHNIRTLEKSLSQFNPRTVFGAIPKDENEDELLNRERMIRQFKSEETFPLLIANPAACAESVSLHSVCRHAVYLDRTFNAAHYLQSLDRIHRIGMPPRSRVHYYIIRARDTIDQVIDERLEDKSRVLNELLEGDLQILDLDIPEEQFSEEGYEDEDFEAVVRHVQDFVSTNKNRDRKARRG